MPLVSQVSPDVSSGSVNHLFTSDCCLRGTRYRCWGALLGTSCPDTVHLRGSSWQSKSGAVNRSCEELDWGTAAFVGQDLEE